jgi:hypothetical protein
VEIIVVIIVGVAAIAIVFYPLLRPDAPAQDVDMEPLADTAAGAFAQDDALESDIARYRAAVRAGTICGRCRQANPPGSKFCYECGRAMDGGPGPGEGDMD